MHGMEWNEIICFKLMLDPPKSGPGASKMRPGGSHVHSNSLLGALGTANWGAMDHLGCHWDTLRAHLGARGSQFGSPGAHFDARGDRFGCPRPPF